MKLIFIENDPDAFRALKTAFDPFTEITVIQGDIFRHAKKAIVAPLNSTNHMDPGIGQEYLEYFGISIYNALIDSLKEMDITKKKGFAATVKTKKWKIPYLVFLYVMMIPQFVSPENCYHAMTALFEEWEKNKKLFSTLYCPALFSGVPGIDYTEAASQMAFAYKHWVMG